MVIYLTYCLWLLPCYNGRVKELRHNLYGLPSLKYFLSASGFLGEPVRVLYEKDIFLTWDAFLLRNLIRCINLGPPEDLCAMPLFTAIQVLMEDGLLKSEWCWPGPQEGSGDLGTEGLLGTALGLTPVRERRVEGKGRERGGSGSRMGGEGEDRLPCSLKGGLSQPNGGSSEADIPKTGPESQTFGTPTPPQLPWGWDVSLE